MAINTFSVLVTINRCVHCCEVCFMFMQLSPIGRPGMTNYYMFMCIICVYPFTSYFKTLDSKVFSY